MLSIAEKKYLYECFKSVLSTMGVQVRYLPLKGKIQAKNGKVSLDHDEVNYIDTWGNFSYNKRQDYSIGSPTETQTENRVSFLVSDFSTFSISPRPKDALDITVRGITKRYIIVGDENGADFPDLYYVCNIDSIEHINP